MGFTGVMLIIPGMIATSPFLEISDLFARLSYSDCDSSLGGPAVAKAANIFPKFLESCFWSGYLSLAKLRAPNGIIFMKLAAVSFTTILTCSSVVFIISR